MFLKSHGGANIKFVGEAFNVAGDVGEGKNCGGAQKIRGESFHGGSYRGVCKVYPSELLSVEELAGIVSK